VTIERKIDSFGSIKNSPQLEINNKLLAGFQVTLKTSFFFGKILNFSSISNVMSSIFHL